MWKYLYFLPDSWTRFQSFRLCEDLQGRWLCSGDYLLRPSSRTSTVHWMNAERFLLMLRLLLFPSVSGGLSSTSKSPCPLNWCYNSSHPFTYVTVEKLLSLQSRSTFRCFSSMHLYLSQLIGVRAPRLCHHERSILLLLKSPYPYCGILWTNILFNVLLCSSVSMSVFGCTKRSARN